MDACQASCELCPHALPLLQVQLPGMPLGALKDMGGIKQQAGSKLALRHATLWQQLSQACDDMERAAQVGVHVWWAGWSV